METFADDKVNVGQQNSTFLYRCDDISYSAPDVVGRKTLLAAGHVISCDTNISTGVESTNNVCRSQLKRKIIAGHMLMGKYTFENSPDPDPIASFTQARRNIFICIQRIKVSLRPKFQTVDLLF